jgi:hypothetical protein
LIKVLGSSVSVGGIFKTSAVSLVLTNSIDCVFECLSAFAVLGDKFIEVPPSTRLLEVGRVDREVLGTLIKSFSCSLAPM